MSEQQKHEAPRPTPGTEYVSPALSRLAGSRRPPSPVRRIVDPVPTAAPVTPAWLLELEPRERLAALDRQLRRAQHQLATAGRRRSLRQRLDQLCQQLRSDS